MQIAWDTLAVRVIDHFQLQSLRSAQGRTQPERLIQVGQNQLQGAGMRAGPANKLAESLYRPPLGRVGPRCLQNQLRLGRLGRVQEPGQLLKTLGIK